MGEACEFCDTAENLVITGEYSICEPCAQTYRKLLTDHVDDTSDVIGLDAVGRDYEPSSGELMYLSLANQFYRVEISHGGEPMIYFQPIPMSEPAVPITDLVDDIQEAIAENQSITSG